MRGSGRGRKFRVKGTTLPRSRDTPGNAPAYAPGVMKLKDLRPSDARIEYRWRVDRAEGFETTALIYDAAGRLKGVDHQYFRRAVTPATPISPAG